MWLSSERSDLPSAGARWTSLALGLSFCLTATAEAAPGAGPAARVREFGSALLFEPNQGQTEAGVEYLARGDGYRLYLRGSEAVLALAGGSGPRCSVRLRLVGAASQPEAVGRDRRPSVSHYLIGADPSLWRRNVRHYGQVEYREVYPGVSLVYYGREGALEYDFVLAPGANPEAIQFEVEGASVRLDDGGNLVLTTPEGDLRQQAPVVYQDSSEGRTPVQGQFVLHGSNRVGFRVSDYDRSKALVIDPVLTWSRFHGGRAADHADGVAVDRAGFIFVTGQTDSDNFPTTPGVLQPLPPGGQDAFVTKFRPDGAMVWSTYLGGNQGNEFGTAIAVDSVGQAYVTGWTESNDFPTKNQLPGAFRPPRDAFVSKLDQNGANLIYSTYLGGQGSDEANGIAVDPTQPDGEAVVVGVTNSDTTFPLVNALNSTRVGPTDGFVTRFKKNGDSLIFSTFWGGRAVDKAFAVALFDNAAGGFPVVVGGTDSDDLPLRNEQQVYRALTDAFVTMFRPDGLDVIFSTYLGGSKDEAAFTVVTDPTGFFIGGQTASTDFPIKNPLQGGLRGPDDGFITKLDKGTFRIEYSTFLGGRQSDKVMGLGVDSKGYMYAAGSTTSDDFPRVDPIFPIYRGNSDVFVAKLAPNGCTLSYSTYLGSDGIDFGNALALGGDGIAYVVGQAGSGFPVTMPPPFQGPSDGFVLRIDDSPTADLKIIGKTATPDPVALFGTLTYTIDVENLGPSGAFDVVFKDTLDSQVLFIGATPASCVESLGIVTCPLGCMFPGQTATIKIDALVIGGPLLTNVAEVTTGEFDPVLPNNKVTTLTRVLSADLEVTKAGPATAPVLGTITYQLTVKNNGPDPTIGITVQDLLPMGTTFQSASLGCVDLGGGVVLCTYPLPLLSGGSTVFTIVVKADIPGIIVNTVSVSGPDLDINPSNNTADLTTRVTGGPTGPVQFFTATATDRQIFLEWKNPAAGPYNSTKILYHFLEGSSACGIPDAFPTGPADGSAVLLLNDGSAGLGGHGTFTLPAVNDTTYCFAAFVQKDAAGTLFSVARYVKSRPFDSTGRVKWAYSTGGASVAPPSYGSKGMLAASGDEVLHSMVRGAGATGGHWPPSWTPLELGGPAQSRHPVIMAPSLIAGSPELVLLGVQDGTARAVDAVTGQEKWQQVLGSVVQAALGGMFKDFGGLWDYGLVGTRDPGDNRFYALDPKTGNPVNFFNNGGLANGIGIISGGAQVDYAGPRVYFASRVKNPGPGSPGTLWCLTLTPAGLGGLCPGAWPVALGDIDSSPVLRNGIIYVGDNLGRVHAVNTDGTLAWPAPFITGDGPIKGFIFPDRTSSALFFTTTNKVWGIHDAGASAILDWSTQLAPGPLPPTPSIVLWNPGTTFIYVGGSDGQLYQIDFSSVPLPPVITSVVLGDGLAVAGAPTLDRLTGFAYVGSDAGIIYAVETPLP